MVVATIFIGKQNDLQGKMYNRFHNGINYNSQNTVAHEDELTQPMILVHQVISGSSYALHGGADTKTII